MNKYLRSIVVSTETRQDTILYFLVVAKDADQPDKELFRAAERADDPLQVDLTRAAAKEAVRLAALERWPA